MGRAPSGDRAISGCARSTVCREAPTTADPALTAFNGTARSGLAAGDSTSSQPFSDGVSGSPVDRSFVLGSETRSRPGEAVGAAGPALRGTSSISQPSADEEPRAALESACSSSPVGSRSPAISTRNAPAAHQNFCKLFVAMTNHPGQMARARLQHTLQRLPPLGSSTNTQTQPHAFTDSHNRFFNCNPNDPSTHRKYPIFTWVTRSFWQRSGRVRILEGSRVTHRGAFMCHRVFPPVSISVC